MVGACTAIEVSSGSDRCAQHDNQNRGPRDANHQSEKRETSLVEMGTHTSLL